MLSRKTKLSQNTSNSHIESEELFNKKFATSIWTTTTWTTRPDVKRIDFEEINIGIVLNIKQKNWRESTENNIVNIELLNQKLTYKNCQKTSSTTTSTEKNGTTTLRRPTATRITLRQASSARTSTATLSRRLRTTGSSRTTATTASRKTMEKLRWQQEDWMTTITTTSKKSTSTSFELSIASFFFKMGYVAIACDGHHPCQGNAFFSAAHLSTPTSHTDDQHRR